MEKKKINFSLIEALIGEMSGVPFIDEDFNAVQLFSITLLKRRSINPSISSDLNDYAMPKFAVELYKSNAACAPPDYMYSFLKPKDDKSLKIALNYIRKAVPEWNYYFSIPVEYYFLDDERPSSTSALIPQTIFLGKNAFVNQAILIESIVHEFSHLWLNFIIEIMDIMDTVHPKLYTLPSGTTGKNVRGVIYAAHFAATVISFYRKIHTLKNAFIHKQRLDYLSNYLNGCLGLIKNKKDLSKIGDFVFCRLTHFASKKNVK